MTNPEGNRQLTPRQVEVLQCLAHGQNAPEAAMTLGISKTTARVHLEALKARLKARTIAHAVLLGVIRGYINIPFVLQESEDTHHRPHQHLHARHSAS